MRKYILVPVLITAGSAGAFLMRLSQMRTGFEALTGLPVPHDPWQYVLPVFLLILAVLLALAVSRVPESAQPPAAFAGAFFTTDAIMLALPAAGILLTALSGVLELAAGLTTGLRAQLLTGILSLLSAGSLLPAAAACRRPGSHQIQPEAPRQLNCALLLVTPVCLVTRLVLTYRQDSVDPTLSAYYIELLAIVFLTLAFYRLASFAFQAGKTRRYLLYAGAAVILSAATLADGHQLSGTLFYAGGALSQLGFLLLRLETLAKP